KFGNPLQQPLHVLAGTKDLIDEIDVIDSARNQSPDLFQDCFYLALAEFVAEQVLVAKRAGPRTPAGKLQLSSQSLATAEYVVTVAVRRNVVILEIQWRERGHVGHAQGIAEVNSIVGGVTAPGNLAPWLTGQVGQRLIRFSAKGNAATCFAH